MDQVYQILIDQLQKISEARIGKRESDIKSKDGWAPMLPPKKVLGTTRATAEEKDAGVVARKVQAQSEFGIHGAANTGEDGDDDAHESGHKDAFDVKVLKLAEKIAVLKGGQLRLLA